MWPFNKKCKEPDAERGCYVANPSTLTDKMVAWWVQGDASNRVRLSRVHIVDGQRMINYPYDTETVLVLLPEGRVLGSGNFRWSSLPVPLSSHDESQKQNNTETK